VAHRSESGLGFPEKLATNTYGNQLGDDSRLARADSKGPSEGVFSTNKAQKKRLSWANSERKSTSEVDSERRRGDARNGTLNHLFGQGEKGGGGTAQALGGG